MENIIGKIKKWSETFNLPVKEKIEISYDDRIKLGINLIKEELGELEDALKSNNKKEVLDASGDLLWVVIRLLMDIGVYNTIGKIIEKIYHSNMSKACYSEQEAINSVKVYQEKGIHTYYRKKENEQVWIIYRMSDNKVLKSINFQEPDFKDLL